STPGGFWSQTEAPCLVSLPKRYRWPDKTPSLGTSLCASTGLGALNRPTYVSIVRFSKMPMIYATYGTSKHLLRLRMGFVRYSSIVLTRRRRHTICTTAGRIGHPKH